MIKTVIKTAPAKTVLRVDGDNSVKLALNISKDFTDDDRLLEDMIGDATEYVEQILSRKLITQTWYLYLDDFPDCDYIVIPFGQLQSVTSIKYKDIDGNESTWSAGEYIVETTSDPGRVVLAYGYTWPSTNLYPSNPITIEFKCGYGDAGDNVPSPIRRAIAIKVGDLYQNRENNIFGSTVQSLMTVENLLNQYRLNRL